MSGERKMAKNILVSVNFEVFGKVQGVFFRKYTRQAAVGLGLKGYVRNTENGTVVGTLQGDHDKVEEMKIWLSKTGSPSSRIDKCIFKNEKQIDKFEYTSFEIQR